MTLQKICWTLSVVCFLILLAIRLIPDWEYQCGVYQDGLFVAQSGTSPRNTGLHGAEVTSLDFDQAAPNRLVMQCARHDFYTSDNHGQTWTPLRCPSGAIQSALWVNSLLVAVVLDSNIVSTLQFSQDLGHSWQPVIPSWQEKQDTLELRQNADFQPLVIRYANDQPTQQVYRLSSKEQTLFFTPATGAASTTRPVDGEGISLRFAHGTIEARAIRAPDGLWAVASGGLFFQPSGSSAWLDRSTSLHRPKLERIEQSPANGRHVLTYDSIGRLWTSRNFGVSWALSEVRDVALAIFLPDESLFVVRLDKSVALYKDGTCHNISPEWRLFLDRQPAHALSKGREVGVNDVHVYTLGGNQEELWMSTGLFVHASLLSLAPLTETHFAALQAELTDYANRVQPRMLIYSRKKGTWRMAPLETLQALEPVSDTCPFNIQGDHDLYLGSKPMPVTRHISSFGRVLVLNKPTRYLWADGASLQIGALAQCQPQGLARLWRLDKAIINKSTRFLSAPESLEGLSITANQIESFTLELGAPPLCRRFLHFFFFHYGAWMIGCALVLWRWRLGKQ